MQWKSALRVMDPTIPLKVSCGIWHHVSRRSFKPSMLQGGAAVDQTCWSSTSQRF